MPKQHIVQICILSENLNNYLNKKYHFDYVIFKTFSTILDFILLYHLYHSVMYVTFTKAEKHRVLSYNEIFQLHRYFTLNIAIFAYFIFICNCMH